MSERRRYYPYLNYMKRVMIHPRLDAVEKFYIVNRNEVVLNREGVGRFRSMVYLAYDNEHGEPNLIWIYRPTTEETTRSQECAEMLRGYLRLVNRLDTKRDGHE